MVKPLKPYSPAEIRIFLLEGIDPVGGKTSKVQALSQRIFDSTFDPTLNKAKLIEMIKDVEVIGIRAETKLTREILEYAEKLLAIGCFCSVSDQVDLVYADERGMAVFSSPSSPYGDIPSRRIRHRTDYRPSPSESEEELRKGDGTRPANGSPQTCMARSSA